MKVWSVNVIYTPWVQHGYEPVHFFSTPELAEECKEKLEAERTDEQKANPEMWGYGYEVEEWNVDAPAITDWMKTR